MEFFFIKSTLSFKLDLDFLDCFKWLFFFGGGAECGHGSFQL